MPDPPVQALDNEGNGARLAVLSRRHAPFARWRFCRRGLSLSMMRSSKAIIERSDRRQAGPFGQVLKFEPRQPGKPTLASVTAQPIDDDLDDFARFEKEHDEPIDYRHRAIMNLIAVAILILLVGLGVWIADTIADLQREQDCLMQGRSNCAPIEMPVGVQQ